MNIKLDVLLVQIVHIVILFWLFKKLIGNSLTQALLQRRGLMDKLADADKTYAQILDEANKKADDIVQEGLEHKNKIIEEAKILAEQKGAAILQKAQQDAHELVAKIKSDEAKVRQELEENFASGVKRTAEVVVKKLLRDDRELQQEYMDQLIKEIVR